MRLGGRCSEGTWYPCPLLDTAARPLAQTLLPTSLACGHRGLRGLGRGRRHRAASRCPHVSAARLLHRLLLCHLHGVQRRAAAATHGAPASGGPGCKLLGEAGCCGLLGWLAVGAC